MPHNHQVIIAGLDQLQRIFRLIVGLQPGVLFFLAAPGAKAVYRIPGAVLVITCALETMQLWKAPFLEAVRSTFIGRTVLGTTFVWWDFPHYVIGAAAAWLLLYLVSSGRSGKTG